MICPGLIDCGRPAADAAVCGEGAPCCAAEAGTVLGAQPGQPARYESPHEPAGPGHRLKV